MKKNNRLLPFENILAGYFTGKNLQTINSLSEAEVKFIFNQPLNVALPQPKVARMIDTLAKELSKESLGVMVSNSLAAQPMNGQQLQEKTGLTPSLVEAIKNDLVFTNSVPVKSLAKLLRLLNLSMESALAAVQVTFDKLQTESKSLVSLPVNIQPSFRKGVVRGELGKDLSHLKSDESYLYQNEEALAKYTSRLKELYTTI
jgi:hypothetical protein